MSDGRPVLFWCPECGEWKAIEWDGNVGSAVCGHITIDVRFQTREFDPADGE